MIGVVATIFSANPARAGAGWGDSTNATADPSISFPDLTTPGLFKVRTYYANSPQGIQFDVQTGGTRDTGTALRKFVDPLPGLGAAPFSVAGSATNGTYIPVAVGDVTSYPGSVYYEIAVVEYTQRMHTDLAKATTLRGYVQIDPVATDALAGLTGNGGVSPTGSKALALTNLDGTPVLISRPSTRPAAVNGFEQVQAVAVDKPSYLGPTILAAHGTPTRVKFYNGLPAGHSFTDAANVWHRQGDLFIPVDHTLFGGGDGQTQSGFKDLLCGDVLAGPNNAGDPTLSACLGGVNPDNTTTLPGYVHVPKFDLYTENREELHLHGGDNPWLSDGHPHQWITPAADELNPTVAQNYKRGDIAYNVPDMPNPGPGAVTYYWPNGQSGRLLFFHDHATGLTRLNVYAGTAAGYLLTDPSERAINALVGGDTHEIPLVIQEKTFVPKDISIQDAKWDSVHWGQEGDLWFPHVYETNQDPLSADATNPVGRWDGASFFWPVFPQTYATPSGEYGNVTTTPEAFMDTPIVNGIAYPSMTVDPTAYRFRILGVGNDRMLNLSLFVADNVAGTPVPNTEVKMVPFNSPFGPTSVTYKCPVLADVGTVNANGTVTKAGWTESGPSLAGPSLYNVSFPCTGGLTGTGWGQADNRPGGVPDPATVGPDIIRIGNEGGLFQQAVVIPATPINYEYNKRSVTVLNVLERSLWLGPAERADVIIDFSQYAGKTLILYNDSGAPVPAGDPRTDYYTGDGDQTGAGGAPNTVAGYGPNSRTILQINVNPAGATAPVPFDVASLNSQLLTAYVATQPKPVVPTPEYAPMAGVMGFTTTAPYEHIFTGAIYLNKYNALTIPAAADVFNYTPAPVCNTTATCLTTLANIRKGANAGLVQSTVGKPVAAYVESKAIQELFETDYGRMNATLGVELPFTNVSIQTTIPLAYVDPATETIANGETQFWKITHNGVDSHPVHFHFINVQVINRVGWDGTIKPIPADEVGWKETVKMHPLEDIIVAVRAKSAPPTPFGMPHSWRQPAPNQLPTDNHGITQIDAATGNAPTTPYTNAAVDYGSEYVWHCHILGHEENDFMRPFIFKAQEVVAPPLTVTTAVAGTAGVAVTWVDPTPVAATIYDPISNQTGFLGNPNNEIGFRVERSPGAVAVTAKTFTPLAAGLVTINPITNPVNAQANATTYTDASAATPAVPAAPAAPSVSAVTATTLTLTFPVKPAGVAGYIVFRNAVAVTPTPITTATWNDTGLTAGTSYTYTLVAVATGSQATYTYRVAAVTAAGDTMSSNVQTVTVTPTSSVQGASLVVLTVPAVPAGLTFANITNVGAVGNWPAITGAASYQLQSGAAVGGPFALITPIVTTNTSTVTGLTGNTNYYFQLDATNASGSSAFGPTPAVLLLTVPDAPTALAAPSATVTSSAVALNWVAPATGVGAGATGGYTVQLATSVAGPWTNAASNVAGVTSTISGLSGSTTYLFRVVGNNASGASAPSNVVTVTTLPGIPAAPTGLVFSNVSASTVTASWTASAGATSYNVSVNSAAATSQPGVTDALTGLTGNTVYGFSITASNVSGVSPTALTGSQLLLPAAPGAPVASGITSSSMTLTWAAPAGGAASYALQYSTNGFSTFTSVPSTTTSAPVTGLAASTAYSFRVVAINATGNSAFSGTTVATTLAGVPVAPTPILGAVTATNVTLSWPAVAGATRYTLYRNGVAVWNGTTLTRRQGGQTAGNTYSFTLAVTTATGTSPQSAAVVVTTLPSRPTTPTVSTAGNTAANHLVTVTVPAKPATETAAITYTLQYQFRARGGVAWGPVTVIQSGITATGAAQAIALGMPAAGRYRFSIIAVDAGGSSAASFNTTSVTSL